MNLSKVHFIVDLGLKSLVLVIFFSCFYDVMSMALACASYNFTTYQFCLCFFDVCSWYSYPNIFCQLLLRTRSFIIFRPVFGWMHGHMYGYVWRPEVTLRCHFSQCSPPPFWDGVSHFDCMSTDFVRLAGQWPQGSVCLHFPDPEIAC